MSKTMEEAIFSSMIRLIRIHDLLKCNKADHAGKTDSSVQINRAGRMGEK